MFQDWVSYTKLIWFPWRDLLFIESDISLIIWKPDLFEFVELAYKFINFVIEIMQIIACSYLYIVICFPLDKQIHHIFLFLSQSVLEMVVHQSLKQFVFFDDFASKLKILDLYPLLNIWVHLEITSKIVNEQTYFHQQKILLYYFISI